MEKSRKIQAKFWTGRFTGARVSARVYLGENESYTMLLRVVKDEPGHLGSGPYPPFDVLFELPLHRWLQERSLTRTP